MNIEDNRSAGPELPARMAELQQAGIRASTLLGSSMRLGDATLALVDASTRAAQALQSVNTRLVPLVERMGRTVERGPVQRWWAWFTGEQLEQQVMFEAVCAEIRQLAVSGQQLCDRLAVIVADLREEQEQSRRSLRALELDIAAATQLLDGPEAASFAAALPVDELHVFQRKAANLQPMQAALQLTVSQQVMAIEQAQQLRQHFDSVRNLLLPLWYQRLGFELFTDRAGAS